jgi:hypothetical protein
MRANGDLLGVAGVILTVVHTLASIAGDPLQVLLLVIHFYRSFRAGFS